MVDLSLNAVELIDRNLYERTCDVRWWATDSAVVDARRRPTPPRRLCLAAAGRHPGAYTVYLDLWLCDLAGRVIANGRADRFRVVGQDVAATQMVSRGAATSLGRRLRRRRRREPAAVGDAPVATYSPASAPAPRPTASRSARSASFSTGSRRPRAIVQGVGCRRRRARPA